MKTQISISLKFLLVMTILAGIIYPLLMTGLAQLCFNSNANGSLIRKEGKVIGSKLIGQKFDSAVYFWSRPSSIDYNPVPSGASNYGPTSDTLKKLVTSRRVSFARINLLTDVMKVPKEMIFASGSGLDPDISPQGALLQVDRIVRERHFNESQHEKLLSLIKGLTEKPQYLLFGEERINVLLLNIALDEIDDHQPPGTQHPTPNN
jgi:potassium-transporting ATPase KdpC subunit